MSILYSSTQLTLKLLSYILFVLVLSCPFGAPHGITARCCVRPFAAKRVYSEVCDFAILRPGARNGRRNGSSYPSYRNYPCYGNH